MPSKWRRFEILLPQKFNDGAAVPEEWLGEAAIEIREHFGAVSYETQIIEGQWTQEGVVYSDRLVRIVVDIPDSQANRRWMKSYRDRWKDRLQQLELWLVSYSITVE
jgi:hypothetical protein